MHSGKQNLITKEGRLLESGQIAYGRPMEFDLIQSGWLDKRGGQDGSKGWKKRWCVLSGNTFRYYKGDHDNSLAGTVFGEDIQEVCEDFEESMKDSVKFGFVFKIITKGRNFILNASTANKRDEWVKIFHELLATYRPSGVCPQPVKYATVEVFLHRGIRVNGDISTELKGHLLNVTTKTHVNEKGWYIENPLPHTTVLNCFSKHGWTLSNAYQSNATPPGVSVMVPADCLVFTHLT